jgi:hypothetical protein
MLNQQSVVDRNFQVALMQLIYQRAQSVRIWLGFDLNYSVGLRGSQRIIYDSMTTFRFIRRVQSLPFGGLVGRMLDYNPWTAEALGKCSPSLKLDVTNPRFQETSRFL